MLNAAGAEHTIALAACVRGFLTRWPPGSTMTIIMRPRRASIARRSVLSVAALLLPLQWLSSAPAASSTPLSNAGPVLQELGKQAQDQSLSEVERIQIIGLLGVWATDDVRAPLVALLGDPLPSVRAAAARGLGWKGNNGATASLKARFETPGEPPDVRVAALEALGRIGDDSARAAVLSATRDTDPAVRGRRSSVSRSRT